MISGKNRASTTVDFEFCINAGKHTVVFEHSGDSAWGTNSYLLIQNGGVDIARHFLDRLGRDTITIYRTLVFEIF